MPNLWKPMLAGTHTDVTKLKFPLLASQKYDGIRATVQEGRLMSRTLKPIPNVNAQSYFKGLPEGLDGELIVGDPCAPDAYRKTTSLVMSDDKPLDWFKGETLSFHVFDCCATSGFYSRLVCAQADISYLQKNGSWGCVIAVPHVWINGVETLDTFEAEMLDKGAEGVMLRDPNGPYKHGRSTENEGYLIKVKRFADAEAVILDTFEEMENTNEAKKNALGRTERSTAKAGKVAKGTLGGFRVSGVGGAYDTVVFDIGGGFTKAQREALWKERDSLPGKIVVFKYFPTGSDTRPRFPVWKGFRDARDL